MPESERLAQAPGVPLGSLWPHEYWGLLPSSETPAMPATGRAPPRAACQDTRPSGATTGDAEGQGAAQATVGPPQAAQSRGRWEPPTPSPPSAGAAQLTRLQWETSSPDAADAAATSAPARRKRRGPAPARRLFGERPLPAA